MTASGEGVDLVQRLQVIHDGLDDPGLCPYFRRGEEGQDPEGTCSFGCRDEPSCMTDYAPPGWPSEMVRLLIADVQSGQFGSTGDPK